jgi:hypothetical protein
MFYRVSNGGTLKEVIAIFRGTSVTQMYTIATQEGVWRTGEGSAVIDHSQYVTISGSNFKFLKECDYIYAKSTSANISITTKSHATVGQTLSIQSGDYTNHFACQSVLAIY